MTIGELLNTWLGKILALTFATMVTSPFWVPVVIYFEKKRTNNGINRSSGSA